MKKVIYYLEYAGLRKRFFKKKRLLNYIYQFSEEAIGSIKPFKKWKKMWFVGSWYRQKNEKINIMF